MTTAARQKGTCALNTFGGITGKRRAGDFCPSALRHCSAIFNDSIVLNGGAGLLSKKRLAVLRTLSRPSGSAVEETPIDHRLVEDTLRQKQLDLESLRHRLPDFVLVYDKTQGGDLKRCRDYFEQNLTREGLLLDLDTDDSTKLCYVKVYAPFALLCHRAQRLQMKVPMQVQLPADPLKRSKSAGHWMPWSLFKLTNLEQKLIGDHPVQVSAPFVHSRLDLYHWTDEDCFFTINQRIRMVHDLLIRARCDPDNKKNHGMQWLLKTGAYKAVYPPHDGGHDYRHLDPADRRQWSVRQVLRYTWANFASALKPQPLNLVQSYFGEKIAFYFAWLGYYTCMLTIPGIAGLLCFVYTMSQLSGSDHLEQICSHNKSSYATITMCPVCVPENCVPWTLEQSCDSAKWNYTFDSKANIAMTIVTLVWACLFLETWKRREATLAYTWNAYDAEQVSGAVRPEYEAESHRVTECATSDAEQPHEYRVPLCKRIRWRVGSAAGVLLLVLMVLMAMIALIAIRIEIYGLLKGFGGFWLVYQFEVTSMVIHLCTFVVVMTLGVLYERSAHRLTEFECPRTETAYLNSYVWKVFIFELLNNFGPIFYAALIRGQNFSLPSDQTHLKEFCDPGGCLNEPVQAIAILLLARLLISNAAELGYPLLKKVLKGRRLGTSEVSPVEDSGGSGRYQPQWRKDFTLNDLSLDGVYTEYLEMMVQFGYVTLFVSLFPLAPLICLLNNIVEVRLDAINFVLSYRRPVPYRVSGIDTWNTCLSIILKLAIVCNSAVLAFTSETIPRVMHRTLFNDSSSGSYLNFTLVPFNTSSWPGYKELYPDAPSICYYRDTYQNTLEWQTVTIARLAVFITLVMFFYVIHWFIQTLLPKLPSDVRNSMQQANTIAREAFYGKELAVGVVDHSAHVKEGGGTQEKPPDNEIGAPAAASRSNRGVDILDRITLAADLG
uniref:Anoctamin n=1 Tax=Trichuris muris TaxID=70415 RepID=A0A5S6QY19_TRIMR